MRGRNLYVSIQGVAIFKQSDSCGSELHLKTIDYSTARGSRVSTVFVVCMKTVFRHTSGLGQPSAYKEVLAWGPDLGFVLPSPEASNGLADSPKIDTELEPAAA